MLGTVPPHGYEAESKEGERGLRAYRSGVVLQVRVDPVPEERFTELAHRLQCGNHDPGIVVFERRGDGRVK